MATGKMQTREIQTISRRSAFSAEFILGLGVILVSLFVRAMLVANYPTSPVSDFKALVTFASAIAEHGPGTPGWYWDLFSAGTPTLLSVLMFLSPGDDVVVARTSTMLVMALLPLLPLLMLRGIVPVWVRVLIAALIALQPAQIIFSGVVAQDNWVQVPVVALACLAIRNARGLGHGSPVWAALLWCLALYIRQEMLLAALPLAALAAWPLHDRKRRVRAVLVFGAISWVMLLGIAGQRQAATDRFALTSSHAGSSLLGSYVPGAGFGWTPYEPYVATVAPGLLEDPERLRANAGDLAMAEIQRRPLFHLLRRLGAMLYAGTGADGTLAYWSLTAQDAQTDDGASGKTGRSASATVFATAFSPWITCGFFVIHALFIGAMFVAIRTRDKALMAVCAAIAIKLAIHLVFASQARFFLVVLSLESIAIGLAMLEMSRTRKLLVGFLIVTLLAAAALLAGIIKLPQWQASVERSEALQVAASQPPQPPVPPALREFTLVTTNATAKCVMEQGELLATTDATASFRVEHPDPEYGEFAAAHCTVSRKGTDDAEVVLEVEDKYAPGGFPDRMFQEVKVGGELVRNHDIAGEAWAGWWPYVLPLKAGSDLDVDVVVRALRPDKGPAWGNAATTDIRLVEGAAPSSP